MFESPIPHPLAWWSSAPGFVVEALEWVVGAQWPEGNEKLTWDLADAFYAAARDLPGVVEAIGDGGPMLVAGWGGADTQIGAVVDAIWRGFAADPEAGLRLLDAALTELGTLTEATACDIEAAKIEMYIEIGFMAVELGLLLAAAIATAGASMAGAPAVIAITRFAIGRLFRELLHRVASRALTRVTSRAMTEAVKGFTHRGVGSFLRMTVKHSGMEALEEAGTNLAIQQSQIARDRRDGLNWTELGMSTAGGAAGGAAGGLAGLGRHASSSFGRAMENLGRGAAGEVFAETGASLVTGGGLPELDELARSATAGARSGITGHTTEALHTQLDQILDSHSSAPTIPYGAGTPDLTQLAGPGTPAGPPSTTTGAVGFSGTDPTGTGTPGGGQGTGTVYASSSVHDATAETSAVLGREADSSTVHNGLTQTTAADQTDLVPPLAAPGTDAPGTPSTQSPAPQPATTTAQPILDFAAPATAAPTPLTTAEPLLPADPRPAPSTPTLGHVTYGGPTPPVGHVTYTGPSGPLTPSPGAPTSAPSSTVDTDRAMREGDEGRREIRGRWHEYEWQRRQRESDQLTERATELVRQRQTVLDLAADLHPASQSAQELEVRAHELGIAVRDLDDRAEQVRRGADRPAVVDVDSADHASLNQERLPTADGAVSATGPSALTGSDDPRSVDRTRPYDERGGLRRPLRADQVALEIELPPAGWRGASPLGRWFARLNDGGPQADPTRGLNCVDCVLSLFETFVHGRPRVSAPRTFDTYVDGDPDRPAGGEIGGMARAAEVIGASQQTLYASGRGVTFDSAIDAIRQRLLAGGPGSFAMITHADPDGGAHAWAAVNDDGVIRFVDPQQGYVGDRPLYTLADGIARLDAVVVDSQARPMPFSSRETVEPDHQMAQLDNGIRGALDGTSEPTGRRPDPNDATKALGAWQGERFQIGRDIFLVDRRAMKHILVRHHPLYWDGSTKDRQTFFDRRMTVQGILSVMREVVRQNRDTLVGSGDRRVYQVQGTVDGRRYVLGVRNGRLAQFYEVEDPDD